MTNILRAKGLSHFAILSISLFLFGCNTTTTTDTNTGNSTNIPNGNAQNINANAENNNSADVSDETSSTSSIEAKEPDQYQAKISMKIEAIGEGKIPALPAIEATFNRDGDNKRMEFNMPNGQKIVYLETGGKNLVILPEKKQYAELNKEAVGMDVKNLMTPEQIVQRAKNIKGLEKIGEEKYAGRDAIKYKYSATTKTNSKAGDVDTESFVFVDKETGLPLKTEITSQSKEGNVKGFKGIKVVTEMSDIKTEVSEEMFKEPEGFEKIDEKQIRSQINLVFNAAGAILQQLVQNANGN